MNYDVLKWLFWASAILISYTYLLYPLTMAALAWHAPSNTAARAPYTGSYSVILAVYNEEQSIVQRIDELSLLISAAGPDGELLVVSDGSTDDTLALAMSRVGPNTRVIGLQKNAGKAAALSHACAQAKGDVIVFADARQRWHEAALQNLLANFTSDRVGAASGELMVESHSGVMQGVGLYWRYEKWLRRNEARIHSVVGVSGSISAVRRNLFRSIPAGTLLDDVYWPMQVVMQGYRVMHDEQAIAYDRLPTNAADEFRRKVRTLSGNFQLVALLPNLLLPWRNPIWPQYISHKLLRLAVPWALLTALIVSLVLHSGVYLVAAALQGIFYSLALIGLTSGAGSRSRLVSACASFVVLNTAALLGFFLWVSGNAAASWHKTHYAEDGD